MLYASLIDGPAALVNDVFTLSPYVGKMRPSLARYLIEKYAPSDSTIYDPFSGSGTVLLEGWVLGHNVIGNDLNYYAFVLSMGKLNPYRTSDEAVNALQKYKKRAENKAKSYNVDLIPNWIVSFYDINTLKEICAWTYYLKKYKEWFLLACLMGILHHQRPGFLSYPASHGAPYLRSIKYPKEQYPEMYQYKNVYEKLLRKVIRSYAHIPSLNYALERKMILGNTATIRFKNQHFSAIITSPPYMKSLTYARDNRLRLWFLGESDWESLDKRISPDKNAFIEIMRKCFRKWSLLQVTGDKCIIVIGDIKINYCNQKKSLSDVLVDLSKKYYTCKEQYYDAIPEKRKVVKGETSIKSEVVIVLERK